jgi:hypothetical protein
MNSIVQSGDLFWWLRCSYARVSLFRYAEALSANNNGDASKRSKHMQFAE